MTRLPETVANLIGPEKLRFRDGYGNDIARDVLDSLNGESQIERVELNVGGHVRISLSEYQWIVADAMSEKVALEDRHTVHVELVNAEGTLEVRLEIEPERGEVHQLEISHRQSAMRSMTGP